MNKLIEAMVRTDTPSREPGVNFEAITHALAEIKERFLDERTKGWTDPRNNRAFPAVSREEAEARWEAAQAEFVRMLLTKRNAPEVGVKLGIGDKPGASGLPASSDYSDPEGQPRMEGQTVRILQRPFQT